MNSRRVPAVPAADVSGNCRLLDENRWVALGGMETSEFRERMLPHVDYSQQLANFGRQPSRKG
jgi:hypothetical protein